MKGSMKHMMVIALAMCVMLQIVAATTATIQVVDKDGNNIRSPTDAKLTITNASSEDPISGCDDRELTSSATRDCELEDGEDYEIKVTHPEYRTIDDDTALENWDDSDKKILVVMQPKADYDLTITIEDERGDEVNRAQVSIKSLDEELEVDDIEDADDSDIIIFPNERSNYRAFSYSDSGETDSDGEIVFEDLQFNTLYEITVEKSGYITKVDEYLYPNRAEDRSLTIAIVKPGSATFTATVRDQDSNALIQGATVIVASKDDDDEYTKLTGADGKAIFILPTPECYDIAVSKEGYSMDSQTNICLNNDGAIVESPYFISSQNAPPVADAGADQQVVLGASVTLDGTGSSDPDGDELTYSWVSDLEPDLEIASTASPNATFTVNGTHTVTLTVSDGQFNSSDTVTVFVESPDACGDGVCSVAERNAEGTGLACPQDCPVCFDAICGIGEDDPLSNDYCPVDCGIALRINLLNETELLEGNSTIVSVVNPSTGAPLFGVSIIVELPNGTIVVPTVAMGQAEIEFPLAGIYTITASSDDYESASVQVEAKPRSDLGWLLWVIVVVVIVIAALFLIRFINLSGRGGAKGYRANKYRRGKPTLSRI
jgi:PKD repeat protein